MAPIVPLYGDRRVDEAPAPATPLSTDIPSRDAFGGGETAARAFGSVEELILKAKKEADETAVQDADNKLAEIQKQLLAEGVKRKGPDAINVPNDIEVEYQKKLGEFEKKLNGTNQRNAFKQRAFERGLQLRDALEKHSTAETNQYKTGVFESAIKLSREDAVFNSSDPVKVEANIAAQFKYLDQLATMDGGIQGKLESLKLDAASKTYLGVLEKKINSFNEFGGVEETQKFFNEVKGKMSAADREAAEVALKKASIDYKALSNSDKLFEKYKYSPTKVQAELSKISDPAERKATRDYFNQAMTDFKAFENFQQEQTMRGVYNKIKESKGDLKTLRPMIRNLDARDQDWFEKLAEQERNGTVKGYDKQYYYEMREMALNDPNKFKDLILSEPEKISRLGSKWEEIVKLRESVLKGDNKLDGVRSAEQVINGLYEAAGYNVPTKKDGKKVWAEYDEFRSALETQIKRTGDDSLENIEAISSGLLKKRKLKSSKAAWGPISGTIIDLFSGEGDPAFKLKVENIDINDIESSIRNDLELSLRDRGYEVTEENIKALYIEALKNDRI